MRRSLVAILGVGLVGCSSSAERKGADARPTAYYDRASESDKAGKPSAPEAQNKLSELKGQGAYEKIPEKREPAPAAPERPRSVTLPDTVELAAPGAAPALPAVATVAVAFVRGTKLVRCDQTLRRLDHELGREQGATVVALEPLGKDASDTVTLDQLAQVAALQHADILLVDARASDADAESTTFVLHASTGKFLAHTKPKASAPAGADLVARLVVSARKPG